MKIINSSQLKLIAILTMIIDHIGYSFIASDTLTNDMFRLIGRLSFPLFAFMVAKGFSYTRNKKDYLFRLVLFGVVSEIPFNLMAAGKWFYISYQNIFFTLALGLLGLMLIEKRPKLRLLIIFAVMLAGWAIKSDYSYMGVLLILFLGLSSDWESGKFAMGYILLIFSFFVVDIHNIGLHWAIIQLARLGSLPLMLMYNGERGFMRGQLARYCMYFVYPTHMLLFAILRYMINT